MLHRGAVILLALSIVASNTCCACAASRPPRTDTARCHSPHSGCHARPGGKDKQPDPQPCKNPACSHCGGTLLVAPDSGKTTLPPADLSQLDFTAAAPVALMAQLAPSNHCANHCGPSPPAPAQAATLLNLASRFNN